MDLDVWTCLVAVIAAGAGAGAGGAVVAAAAARAARDRDDWGIEDEVAGCRRPLVLVAAVGGAVLTVRRFDVIGAEWRSGAGILVIAAGCWLLVRVAVVVEAAVFQRMPVDVNNDDRRLRRTRTQVAVLRRVVAVSAVVVGVGWSLMLLPELHSVGASLFASAGLAGIVAGLAAQATLANMFAGMQLAVTDALRIDDVVVVEGEWGWIEEITLTYVVVHIWDERRLVLPTSYFTTSPFQNWTRHQARLLGSVILHLDFATPLTALREHARQVIENSPLWDGKDWVLQVTDTTETTMVIRVLASAKDGPTSWDLCCEIREALLVYLQEEHPQAMPVRRLITLPDAGPDLPQVLDRSLGLGRLERGAPLPRRSELRRAEERRARADRDDEPRALEPYAVDPRVAGPTAVGPRPTGPRPPAGAPGASDVPARPVAVRPVEPWRGEARRVEPRRVEPRRPESRRSTESDIPLSRKRMPAPRRPRALHGPR